MEVNRKRIWELAPLDPGAMSLCKALNLPLVIGAILWNRGIRSASKAREFMRPRLSDILDPMVLPDMEKAINLIFTKAIKNNGGILIYGDYDADGLTATALLCRFFREIGVQASYYIPSRFKEGYGVNRAFINGLDPERYALVITVDCGSLDWEALSLAKSKGIEVVVTDHHLLPKDIPALPWPIINPKRLPPDSGLWEISGVGVAFYLAIALRRLLREKGFFKSKEPQLKDLLDLVAIGMVADRVKVVDQARVLISSGISQLRKTKNPGLLSLKEVCSLSQGPITTDDIGFRLGPRLNAPGRVHEPGIVMEALLTQEEEHARKLAITMDALNSKRKSLEDSLVGEVEEKIQGLCLSGLCSMVFSGTDWHQGVLGLVASRLSSKYYRPVLMITCLNGRAKGSGRSIPEVDLFDAMTEIRHFFERFGGHRMAVGFSLTDEKIHELKPALEEVISKRVSPQSLVPKVSIDMCLDLDQLKIEELKLLSLLEPFGEGNPEPVFLARGVEILTKKVVGGEHLKMIVRQGNRVFEAIAFGVSESEMKMARTDLLYTPIMDLYKGHEMIGLKIVDIVKEGESVPILKYPGS